MLCVGCTPAPVAPPPVIVYSACPKVSYCPMPESDPVVNGDLSADIRRLEHVLKPARCRLKSSKTVRINWMKKAISLRKALTDAVPQLKTNPEMMRIFANEGNIDARLAATLSHEKIYTLNVIVCDFVGDPDLIFVPVAAWLRKNQPDICTLDDGRKKGYSFQMDLNDGDNVDISISLQLTERTIIKEENGALHVSYAPEPFTRPK